jgi:hypothetical protein
MSAEKENEPFDWRKDPNRGGQFFSENRNKNVQLLLQYPGQVVAWYPDGSGIAGADPDGYALYLRLKAAGEDPQWFVFETVEVL